MPAPKRPPKRTSPLKPEEAFTKLIELRAGRAARWEATQADFRAAEDAAEAQIRSRVPDGAARDLLDTMLKAHEEPEVRT